MNKPVFRYLFSAVLILIAIGMLWQNNYISLVKKVSFTDLLVVIFLSLLLAVSRGYTLAYLITREHKTKISFADMVLLPLMMGFWGFFIPVKGGMLYSILFLKAKYKVRALDSTSVTVYIHMVMFSLMGSFGICYIFFKGQLLSIGGLISLLFLLNPLILKGANLFFQKFAFKPAGFPARVQALINSIVINSSSPLTNIRTTAIVVGLSLSRLLFRTARYYWATLVFGLEIPVTTLIILTLTVEFAMITIRFSPGNLGVNELLSGGVMGLLGSASQEGILIELLCRFSTLLLTFTVGAWAVGRNMKYFKMDTFKSLWSALKTKTPNSQDNDLSCAE